MHPRTEDPEGTNEELPSASGHPTTTGGCFSSLPTEGPGAEGSLVLGTKTLVSTARTEHEDASEGPASPEKSRGPELLATGELVAPS